MIIADVLRDARKNRGGTYLVTGYDLEGWHFDKADHIEGYYVSMEYGMTNIPDTVLTRDVLSAYVSARNLYDHHYLGLWMDELGLWHVDVTRWERNLHRAIHIGKLNDQRTIWDIKMSEAIPVNTTR